MADYGSAAQARVVIRRHVAVQSPEARLWVDVIHQALSDAKRSRGKTLSSEARDAMRFFYDGRVDTVADVIGIEPEFVREIAMKCGVRDPGPMPARAAATRRCGRMNISEEFA